MTSPKEHPSQDHIERVPSTVTGSKKLDKIDTVHQDEALKVLLNYEGDSTWSPDEEAKLVRKIDRRLLVILVLTFAIQFYDKFLFSHAAIFGMRTDLKLTVGNRFSMASSIFYLGYIVGAYPATFLAQRFPIHIVAFAMVCLWGACVLAGGWCNSFRELYVQRFFLGLLESGVSPVWMMVVGGWYTKVEQTFRMGVWFAAAPMMAIPAPLINFGLGHIKGSLSPWRYMFIFAGCITIVWAFVILFCMDPDPITARHLSDREKFIAVSRLRVNNSGVRNKHFKREQVFEALGSPLFWLLFFMSATVNTVNAVTSTFTPLIINVSMGYTGLNSLLLTMPTGAVGVVVTLALSWVATVFSRYNLRIWSYTFSSSILLLSCVLIWNVPHMANGFKLVCLYLLAFHPAAYAVLMNLSIANIAGYTKRSTVSAGLFVGYCIGNFAGPLTFLQSESPRYTTGWTFITACLASTILMGMLYRFLCQRANKSREAAGVAESFDNAYVDDMTDVSNLHFRYIY
ncbi:transporter [Fusarium mundagurra]|uniref:Transporter n=1 Tax=Fusarium mundagurra TaxID=1567541 RepID=A0A8H5XSS7_9HYPO|nr:transporter [Fusarium mundagurra]